MSIRLKEHKELIKIVLLILTLPLTYIILQATYNSGTHIGLLLRSIYEIITRAV